MSGVLASAMPDYSSTLSLKWQHSCGRKCISEVRRGMRDSLRTPENWRKVKNLNISSHKTELNWPVWTEMNWTQYAAIYLWFWWWSLCVMGSGDLNLNFICYCRLKYVDLLLDELYLLKWFICFDFWFPFDWSLINWHFIFSCFDESCWIFIFHG